MLIRAEIDGYRNSWKDQMVSYDGQTITYDAIVLFCKLDDTFNITLNAAILCGNYTDVTDYIKPDCC